MDKYESEHNKTIERYAMLIKQLFGIALNEFAQVASIVEGDYSGNEMFNFDDYPQTKATVAKIVNTLAHNMNVSVVNGCQAVWDISNRKNNALVESLFKGKDLTDEQKIRYFQNNEPALKAFTERKHNGLRLSERVWNIVGGYKNDIETALSVSIEQGKSAHDLAKEVQQYLNEPNRLFRRVRDEFGELQLSKNAKNYHPGAGVYRSSYKNAMRLARTEINMAYRTADFTRYQQFDFVVGIEIKTSHNHPEQDICDQLAGRYPKDFKFVGWHPNCRCYQKTILKTEEEMEQDEERMRKGQEPTANSENSVKDVPDGFREWAEDNEDKIKRAKNKPYFVADNPKYFTEQSVEISPEQRREMTLQKAKERHAARTKEEENKITSAWNERKQIHTEAAEIIAQLQGIPDIKDDLSSLDILNKTSDLESIKNATSKLKKVKKEIDNLTYLDNPLQVAKDYTIVDAKTVNTAIKTNIEDWRKLDLSKQKEKLEFEIKWVEDHKKYKTWKVAQDGYKLELEKVMFKIDVEDAKKSIDTLKSTTSDYKLIAKIDKLKKLKIKDKTDLAKFKTEFEKVEKYKIKLEKLETDRKDAQEYFTKFSELYKEFQKYCNGGIYAELVIKSKLEKERDNVLSQIVDGMKKSEIYNNSLKTKKI